MNTTLTNASILDEHDWIKCEGGDEGDRDSGLKENDGRKMMFNIANYLLPYHWLDKNYYEVLQQRPWPIPCTEQELKNKSLN